MSTVQQLLNQRSNFQQAYDEGRITQAQYNTAMSFVNNQLAQAYANSTQITSTHNPATPLEKTVTVSTPIYESIHNPETPLSKTPGTTPIGYEVITRSTTPSPPMDPVGQAIGAAEMQANYQLQSGAQQGTAAPGLTPAQIRSSYAFRDSTILSFHNFRFSGTDATSLGTEKTA